MVSKNFRDHSRKVNSVNGEKEKEKWSQPSEEKKRKKR